MHKWAIFAFLVSVSWRPDARPVLHVATASNFAQPVKAIVATWPEKHNVEVRLSFGASGKFYAQIRHGAPFALFLSADQDKPARLVKDGLARPEHVITYSIGRLVLWSSDRNLIKASGPNWQNMTFDRIAIANPRTAPYGLAAMQYIERQSLQEITQDKLVTGENIAQAFAYVKSGNAQLGLIALSQWQQLSEDMKGSAWIVPEHYHASIRQDAVMLKSALENPYAVQFLNYLTSPEVAKIIQHYGYRTATEGQNAQ